MRPAPSRRSLSKDGITSAKTKKTVEQAEMVAEVEAARMGDHPYVASGPQAYKHEIKAGHSLEVAVGGDDGQIALEGRGGNQRVDVADKPGTVRQAQSPADVCISIQDGISEEIRIHLAEECSKRALVMWKVAVALDIFSDLGIDQDTGRYLVAGKPGSYEVNGCLTTMK